MIGSKVEMLIHNGRVRAKTIKEAHEIMNSASKVFNFNAQAVSYPGQGFYWVTKER